MKNVIISGAKGFLSKSLAEYFIHKGYCLWEKGNPLDMFVYIIEPQKFKNEDIKEPLNYDKLLEEYENTAISMLETVSACLPLFEGNANPRICFINSINSSINRVNDFDGGYDRIISAACNMAIKTMFNRLRPLGYTFRIFAARDMGNSREASYAAEYFIANRSFEEGSFEHSDENRLVMRDMYEQEIPW